MQHNGTRDLASRRQRGRRKANWHSDNFWLAQKLRLLSGLGQLGS